MDDEEDVKKMIEFIKFSKEDNTQDFQYDEFINFQNSDAEEDDEDVEIFDENYYLSSFSGADISKLNTYDPISVLKLEERAVIDSCTDQDLQKLLLLNRTKNIQLMKLYKNLKDLLIQCQKDIQEKSEVIANFLKVTEERAHSSGAWRLAAPYFKDKKLFSCPPNADTLRKQKNKELSPYDIVGISRWSHLECQKLLRAVKVNYNINQQNEVLKKIVSIEQGNDLENHDQLTDLKTRLQVLKEEDNEELPPLNSNKNVDWMRITEIFLQDHRNWIECRSFWHLYLHPKINKSPWTPAENSNLKRLVIEYKFQNWDKIADEVGNNRTGFTACMNYYRNIHEKLKKGDFSFEEDCKLMNLVHKHKMANYIPWVKIGQYFKNRSRAQLFHRFTYYLSQNDKKKGKFTDAEDVLLMILVDRFGKNFTRLTEYMPYRSAIQLKSRYTSNLQQKLKKGSFTAEEDQTIMTFVEEHGETWSKLTNVLHRSRNQIRQRYHIIKEYLAKHPDVPIASVPRRKHNMAVEEDSFVFLRIVADRFRKSTKIPTVQELEMIIKHQEETGDLDLNVVNKGKTINAADSSVTIDAMLTNFFSDSYKIKPQQSISIKHLNQATENVQTVLDTLNVQLDIPENFDEDKRLDNLDVAILNILSEKKATRNQSDGDISKLLPPNMFNIVGLRSLLIKYSENKLQYNDQQGKERIVTDIRSNIVKRLWNLSEEDRQTMKEEQELFYRRFQALFKWPAIMSLINPLPELLNVSSSCLGTNKIQVKRTYSRADRNQSSEIPEKRAKTSEPASSVTEPASSVMEPAISVMEPASSITEPDSSITKPDSSITKPDGSITEPASSITKPSSSVMKPASSLTKLGPLKLTPVRNKSVIQDLLLNKNKKLFSMQTVKRNGETKALIREIDFRKAEPIKTASSSVSVACDRKVSQIVKGNNSSVRVSKVNNIVPKVVTPKVTLVVSPQKESIMLAAEENEANMDTDEELSGIREEDDEEDLKKLENFLKKQRNENVSNIEGTNEDLEDLRRLEKFLEEYNEDMKDFVEIV